MKLVDGKYKMKISNTLCQIEVRHADICPFHPIRGTIVCYFINAWQVFTRQRIENADHMKSVLRNALRRKIGYIKRNTLQLLWQTRVKKVVFICWRLFLVDIQSKIMQITRPILAIKPNYPLDGFSSHVYIAKECLEIRPHHSLYNPY